MAGKRSPRYPRLSLSKAVGLIERLYRGAHQSKVDVDTAARVMGYSNSSSGAAAVAIGALRQYGLVDGLRGDIQVSDLAMRIIQPMEAQERTEGLREAAAKPEIFGQVLTQFGGEIPRSDEPIKAYLVRQLEFSPTGAAEVVSTLRETLSDLPAQTPEPSTPIERDGAPSEPLEVRGRSEPLGNQNYAPASSAIEGELIVLPLGANCKAELRFLGEVTAVAYDRLIRHLQLLRETMDEDVS